MFKAFQLEISIYTKTDQILTGLKFELYFIVNLKIMDNMMIYFELTQNRFHEYK